MYAALRSIEYHLPERTESNEVLREQFPDWEVERLAAKTGIHQRYISGSKECASDLAYEATKALFATGVCVPSDIDFLIVCTQSPDFFLPSTACILQQRLGIPVSAGAFDMNLGCSGYIYGLGVCQGLIESGQATKMLLITADTYTKFISPRDRSVRTLFSDAAAVTLLSSQEGEGRSLGPFVYGTDGRGASNLIVPAGGLRNRSNVSELPHDLTEREDVRGPEHLYMNGAEIFTFTLRAVPKCVEGLLDKAGIKMDDIDLFVMHQANQHMLSALREKMKIPPEKVVNVVSEFGNTVSSSIPIALRSASYGGRLGKGDLVMLIGFGVGYSWGATLIRW